MAAGGLALKGLSFFPRIIQFCAAAIILGIFSYFLAILSDHHLHIDTYVRAVEGISGAAVLYTIFAGFLVWCLGGVTFFAFFGMLLDIAFTGAFAYVAYATRHGTDSCTGIVNTPLGVGGSDSNVSNGNGGVIHLPSLHTACKLNTACFALSIIAIVFFLLSIPLSFALARHHKKEKAFGPSPNNGYTAGTRKRKFWQRKSKNAPYVEKNPDALPVHTAPSAIRDSYATDTTAVGNEPAYNKYGPGGVPQQTGYTTQTTTHTPHAGAGGYQPYTAGATGTHNTNGTF